MILTIILIVTIVGAEIMTVVAVRRVDRAQKPAQGEQNEEIQQAVPAAEDIALTEGVTGTSAQKEDDQGTSHGKDVQEEGVEADAQSDKVQADDGEVDPSEENADETDRGRIVLSAQMQKLLDEMTLEEKVYQMFIVTPEQLTGVSEVTASGKTTRDKLEQQPVGGIIYSGPNLVDPKQTKEMLSKVQAYAKEIEGVSLFVCVDEEGGSVARVARKDNFNVKNVGPMSKVKTPAEARECGDTIGTYLSELGFNVDFAPDADVLTNSQNKVIGDRSFGSDAAIVTACAAAYSDGLHDHKILSTYKHFPGHGATLDDTHEGFAYTDKTLKELETEELMPFADAQKSGVDMVMVAHISVPEVVGDNTPCSLSKKMITEILKGKLGFQGLVVTDAMSMGAITQYCGAAEAAVKTVEAGTDLILMPADLAQAHKAICEAVQKGTITEERIDESVTRILWAKERME